ncbi:SLATT domain-containing protein [Vibrio crassostreae]|uniref:SLATT domain-containing protein n=1 Tax=Vibrio crassostreae TaxID=246167 RepID=UPI0018E43704|nr:SLATT domain-containing protein [Vibrio crassostreae]
MEKFLASMRITAKCRYNASVRLFRQSRFSFFTTTLLSLGLIFIPLMQNANVPLAFKASVLNMVQIFLAVSILVYSVIISTARYDLRAEKLNECGDKLKDLIRSMKKDIHLKKTLSDEELSQYQQRYQDVTTDTENHERSDFNLATLEMKSDYFITGIPRTWLFISSHIQRLSAFIVPTLMISFEIIFILDMLGVTCVFVEYFNASPDVPSGQGNIVDSKTTVGTSG